MIEAINEYDEAVVEKYKNFVGKKEVKQLTKMFKPEKFAGKWKQVMCSPSTGFFGSGPNYSSVEAKYTLKKNGLVGVENGAYNIDLNRVGVKGVSGARDEDVPTCRTVKFDNLFKNEGEYWILYATPSFKTIIVAAPIIIKLFNTPVVITNNFGHYVLTRNRKQFWSSPKEYEHTLDALKKYGFDKLWNKPVATGESFNIVF